MNFEDHITFIDTQIKFINLLTGIKVEEYVSWDDQSGVDKATIITIIFSGLFIEYVKKNVSRMPLTKEEIEKYIDGLLIRLKEGILING